MKKTITAAFFAICFSESTAQNVLIGSGTANSNAIMEVRSTNKGILIPRLSTLQRNDIATPAAGLLVYDTNRNELYGYNGSAWRYLLDDGFWKTSGANVYNVSDSIGIGISSPDEKLHVNGTISTDNGDLLFNETSGTTSKLISDYNGLNVNGYSHNINFYDGTTRRGLLQYQKFDDAAEHRINFTMASTLFSVQTNGSSYLVNDAATMQLQNNGVDKGFIQISGNDFRLGTNSSNNNGSFILRNGGTDRFWVDNAGRVGIGQVPVAGFALNVAGVMKGSGNMTTNTGTITALNVEVGTEVNNSIASGTASMLPLYYGSVTAAGVCNCSAAAVTVGHPFYGNYVLAYPGMSSSDIVIVSVNEIDYRVSTAYGGLGQNYPGFLIMPINNSYSGSSTADVEFSFMVFKK